LIERVGSNQKPRERKTKHITKARERGLLCNLAFDGVGCVCCMRVVVVVLVELIESAVEWGMGMGMGMMMVGNK
jgi:hypothetical protein